MLYLIRTQNKISSTIKILIYNTVETNFMTDVINTYTKLSLVNARRSQINNCQIVNMQNFRSLSILKLHISIDMNYTNAFAICI